MKRAKSCVDPRKYTHQTDWKKKKTEKDSYTFNQSKRVTLADQMFIEKKEIPGPPKYDNKGLTPKVHGFYKPSEVKCSVTGSVAYEKKHVPSPAMYESRGKSMADLLKDKAVKFNYVYKPDPAALKTSCKWKKNNEPAPTTYEFPIAKDKTSSMRSSIKNSVPKSKNSNFLCKCTRQKLSSFFGIFTS